MNSYIDFNYYSTVYNGTKYASDDDAFKKATFNGSLLVDKFTLFRSKNFDDLWLSEQDAIQLAVALYIDYVVDNGDIYNETLSSSTDSVTIGKYSETGGAGGTLGSGDQRLSDAFPNFALDVLRAEGLTNRLLDNVEPPSYNYTFKKNFLDGNFDD